MYPSGVSKFPQLLPSSRLIWEDRRAPEGYETENMEIKYSYHFELEVELLTIHWPIVQNGKFSAAAALLVKTLKKVDFLKIHVDKQQTHDQAKKIETCCMHVFNWLTLHLEALLFRTSVTFQIFPLKVLVFLLPSFWEAFWKWMNEKNTLQLTCFQHLQHKEQFLQDGGRA